MSGVGVGSKIVICSIADSYITIAPVKNLKISEKIDILVRIYIDPDTLFQHERTTQNFNRRL